MEPTEQEPMSANSTPADDATPAPTGSRRQALRAKGSAVAERVKTGQAANLWSRLSGVDFMDSSIQFAGTMLLCVFPLLVVVSDLLGKDVRRVIIVRMGLDPQAAADINKLITANNQAVANLTVVGAAFLVLCALGFASTLQGWYQRVYDVPPAADYKRGLFNRAVWVLGWAVSLYVLLIVGKQTGPAGGRLLIGVCILVISTLFWWWGIHMLLLARVTWREAFPAGLATAVCLLGLGFFSSHLFSNSVVSDYNTYGPIGVVTVLLSFCIGFAVCVHLGAVIGRMWNEAHQPQVADSDATASEAAAPG